MLRSGGDSRGDFFISASALGFLKSDQIDKETLRASSESQPMRTRQLEGGRKDAVLTKHATHPVECPSDRNLDLTELLKNKASFPKPGERESSKCWATAIGKLEDSKLKLDPVTYRITFVTHH